MSISSVLESLESIKDWQEETYKYLHSHPELSMKETETTKFIGKTLESYGYEVKFIGGGVVGILKNGEGQTVLFRADIDALPVEEKTKLPYASKVKTKNDEGISVPVMHACGHDFHIVAGLGAAWALANNKSDWSGTYIALFQPGEEISAGALSMLNDDLINKIPKPDVALAQHVLLEPESGKVATLSGPMLSTAASLKVTIRGAGAHGSMPHLSIDPIVISSSIVMRLQTIISREINPFDFGVVTVGSFQSGSTANVIPDQATLLLNIRAYSDDVKSKIISSIKRIIIEECKSGNCHDEPLIEVYDEYPLTDNNKEVTEKVTKIFKKYLGGDNVLECNPVTASEDFSYIPEKMGIPYTYWAFGGFANPKDAYPNHSPYFAPIIQPTLSTGTKAATLGSLSFLGKS